MRTNTHNSAFPRALLREKYLCETQMTTVITGKDWPKILDNNYNKGHMNMCIAI